MKQAVLLHGTGGNDKDYFWFVDTKEYLEQNGYTVWWPALPNTDSPDLESALKFIQQNMPALDEESILIGHSSACPLILSILQRNDLHIKQVILVAGYYAPIGDTVSGKMIEKQGYDWDKIRESADQIILINSDDDPWGCDDVQARPVTNNLQAKFVLTEGQGHMGSLTYNQPYREHSILKDLLSV